MLLAKTLDSIVDINQYKQYLPPSQGKVKHALGDSKHQNSSIRHTRESDQCGKNLNAILSMANNNDSKLTEKVDDCWEEKNKLQTNFTDRIVEYKNLFIKQRDELSILLQELAESKQRNNELNAQLQRANSKIEAKQSEVQEYANQLKSIKSLNNSLVDELNYYKEREVRIKAKQAKSSANIQSITTTLTQLKNFSGQAVDEVGNWKAQYNSLMEQFKGNEADNQKVISGFKKLLSVLFPLFTELCSMEMASIHAKMHSFPLLYNNHQYQTMQAMDCFISKSKEFLFKSERDVDELMGLLQSQVVNPDIHLVWTAYIELLRQSKLETARYIDKQHATISELQEVCSKKDKEVEDTHSEVNACNKTIEDLKSNIDSLMYQGIAKEREIDSLKNNVSSLQLEVADATATNGLLNKSVEKYTGMVNSYVPALKACNYEIDNLKAKIKAMEEEHKAREIYWDMQRSKMEARLSVTSLGSTALAPSILHKPLSPGCQTNVVNNGMKVPKYYTSPLPKEASGQCGILELGQSIDQTTRTPTDIYASRIAPSVDERGQQTSGNKLKCINETPNTIQPNMANYHSPYSFRDMVKTRLQEQSNINYSKNTYMHLQSPHHSILSDSTPDYKANLSLLNNEIEQQANQLEMSKFKD